MSEDKLQEFIETTYNRLFEKYGRFTLNKKECASELGVSIHTFNKLIRDKKIDINLPTKVKKGEKVYIPTKTFAEAIAKMKV